MIKLKDIAEACGKSVSTVSNILANPKNNKYGRETAELVLATAEKLGYVPNRLARGLLYGKTGLLGIVHDPCYKNDMFLSVLYLKAEQRGIDIVTHVVDVKNGLDVYHAVEACISSQCESILLTVSGDAISEKALALCEKHSVRVGLYGRTDNDKVFWFDTDREQAFYLAAKELLAKSPEKIRLVIPSNLGLNAPRVKGFKKAVDEFGLSFNNNQLVCLMTARNQHTLDYLADSYETAYAWAREQGQAMKGTSFLTYNDAHAAGIVNGALDNGLKIPDDLQVIGYDDHPIATVCRPALSTMKADFMQLAESALDVCFSDQDQQVCCSIPATLILRDSTL